jgi:hypothetical protein
MDEYQIVERVKDWYRTASIKEVHNYLLNDRTIISMESYKRSYGHTTSLSKQVTGYVYNDTTFHIFTLEFPMLQWKYISYAYLHKKGYVVTPDELLGPDPLPNLKYVIYCIKRILGYEFQDRLVIELVDLDVVANNLNLPKIVSSVLGPELLRDSVFIEYDELHEIKKRVSRQKLFAGHTWDDAEHIVRLYFDKNERDLSKEVLKISEAYQRVFRPRRVVYDTKTWQPVLV